MEQNFDLNIDHIRTQIDTDFPQIPTTDEGTAQKNILTWLELRHRINARATHQKKVGDRSFEQCVEEWSKGGMSYPEILKKAKQLMGKNAAIESQNTEEVKALFNSIGDKPIEAKRLGMFRTLANRVIKRLKNVFSVARQIFKSRNASVPKKPSLRLFSRGKSEY